HLLWTHHSAGSRVPLRPHGWLFERDKGGGWVGAWASHAVDTVRWLLGEIVEADGRRRITIAKRPDRGGGPSKPVDAEDGVTAWLTTETGASAILDSSFAATADLASRIVVIGSEGVVECVADARLTLRRPSGEREEIEIPITSGGERHGAAMAA